jgi:hypothetical protein
MNTVFRSKTTINAGIDIVWQKLIDVKTWHIWDTEVLHAEIDGVFDVGAKGVIKPKVGPQLSFIVVEVSPKQFFSFEVFMPVGSFIVRRYLAQLNGGIEFTDEIEFLGPLRWIMASLLGRKFKKILPSILSNFKSFVEKYEVTE